MGSTGSGNFSDYSGSKKKGGGGGSSGVDKCQQAFSSALEEVAQCEFYIKSKNVPKQGDHLRIIFDKRIFAIDSNGIKVGALPTSFNYLASCLAEGINYVGVVTSSSASPYPFVEADFGPQT